MKSIPSEVQNILESLKETAARQVLERKKGSSWLLAFSLLSHCAT